MAVKRSGQIRQALCNILVACIKAPENKWELAVEKILKMYPSDAEALKKEKNPEDATIEFVKGKLTTAKTFIRENFMRVDGKKVRVYRDEEKNAYLDVELKNKVPETAEEVKFEAFWPTKSRKNSTKDELIDSLLLSDF